MLRITRREDISKETPRVERFYLLPKIHKRLHSVSGISVISNSGFYTENISVFLDFYLQPLAKQVNSYIKDTNDFLKKLKALPKLFPDVIICAIDAVGFYSNISHEDGLKAFKKKTLRIKDKIRVLLRKAF